MRYLKICLAIILLTFWFGTLLAQDFPERLKRNVYFLASDSLKGRFPGSEEDKQAAAYIAGSLKNAGLKLFDETGLLPFNITTSVEASDANFLRIDTFSAKYGEDYALYAFSESGHFMSEMVFAGFGMIIQTDSLVHNDYEGLDVKGKWVLVLKGDPQAENNDSPFIPFADARNKALFARDQGALGLILVGGVKNNPNDELSPLLFERGIVSAGIPVLDIRKKIADSLILKNIYSVDSLESGLINGEKMNVTIRDLRIEAHVEIIRNETTTFNIAGYLEGNDPILKHEYVVIGAHYDHLGMGGSGSGSRTPDTLAAHIGADDNASGTAGVMDLAYRLSERRSELKRSILFVLFGAEEMGLLGSRYFVDHLPVEQSKIVAMINLDMIGRLNEQKAVVVGGTGTSPIFEPLLQELDLQSAISLSFSPEGFGASDHASFYAVDIPVMFFSTGAHADYHTPADTPEKINFEGMSEVLDLIELAALKLINNDERPEFTEAGPKQRNTVRRGFKVTFGIMPDFTSSATDGLGVGGVTKGGPAEISGMKKGDKITGINGMSVGTIYDYMNRLRQLKPGQRVNVDIIRDGEPMFLIVEL